MTLEEMKKRKEELGFSSRELAELAGLPVGTVQKIFSGQTKRPRHDTLEALTLVLARNHYEDIGNVLRETPAAYGEDNSSGRIGGGGKTIADWEALPDGVNAELIAGRLYYMAAPMTVHQEIVMEVAMMLKEQIRQRHRSCRVFPAPTGIRLFRDNKTMVEPDIAVVCDRNQIGSNWIEGAPDLVVEVISTSDRRRDLVEKTDLYSRGGVKEYWIVDPKFRRVMVYDLTDNDTVLHLYSFQDRIPIMISNGECSIDFSQVWEEISYLYDEDGNLKP